MGIIHKLPQTVINKIAAGEVIERPASVVKELVENSIDAQAARIDVHLERGGKKLIRVADDGVGMLPDDVAASVRSHATSKLRDSDDLFFVTTMGFRGEALPSIGSVAHLRVLSRVRGSPEGAQIDTRGSETSQVRAAGCPEGTTVEARNLFFNVPARRKFLRTDATELGHVADVLTKLALAYPHIHFRLTHGKRQVFDAAPQQDRSRRLEKFFGADLARSLIPVTWGEGTMSLEGFVGPPSETRASGRLQYTFLNGRFVRNRFIWAAVREAYKGLLTVGRQPVAFLFLQVDPREVDVNVHPTKIEVRFRNTQAVYVGLLNAIRSKLHSLDLRPEIRAEAPPHRGPARPARPPATPPPAERGPAQGELLADQRPPPELTDGAVQLHDRYIVEQQPDAIVITDQHALHERILYEQIRRRLGSARLESQRMLLPATVELARDEVLALEGSGEELRRVGIAIEPFGPNVVAVQALPAVVGQCDVKEFVRELLAAVQDQAAGEPVERLRERLMQTIACKGAVKAGQRLNAEEIRSLLRRRDETGAVSTCPHGRPVALKLTLDYLDKHFKRR